MRKPRLVLFYLALTLVLTGFAAAQEEPAMEEPAMKGSEDLVLSDPDAPATMVVTGKAVNASPGEIIVETDEGQKVFVVDTESLHPEPIAEGQAVTVWYVERADQLYATAIETGDQVDPGTLPQTASRQPFLALAGLVALAGALSLWQLRKVFKR
jgi:LPXTG-motif cell wall-anchored protein